MLKLQKQHLIASKLASVCLFFILLTPVSCATVNLPDSNNEGSQIEVVRDNVSIKDLDVEPINTKVVKKTVIPDTKKEGEKVMFLFFKTMFAVAFCALLLYFLLLFIKKFYGNTFLRQEEEELENLDLSTPQNKQEALKSFLGRVK